MNFIFTPKNTYPKVDKMTSQKSLDTRLGEFFSHTGKNDSVNSLRSSYVSHMVHHGMIRGKLLSVKEKNKIADRMLSSSLQGNIKMKVIQKNSDEPNPTTSNKTRRRI